MYTFCKKHTQAQVMAQSCIATKSRYTFFQCRHHQAPTLISHETINTIYYKDFHQFFPQ
jgi:hypothetical protein